MGKEQDQIFIQNFIIILVMMLGMVAIFVIIARTIGTDDVKIAKQRALVIAEQTLPVASVKRATETVTSAPSADGSVAVADANPGKTVYDGLCFSCHGSGLPNIPQVGKVEDWTDRITQGSALLYERAINGYVGASGMAMPAKGGNATLSDDQIKAAVDYMVSSSQPPEVAPAP